MHRGRLQVIGAKEDGVKGFALGLGKGCLSAVAMPVGGVIAGAVQALRSQPRARSRDRTPAPSASPGPLPQFSLSRSNPFPTHASNFCTCRACTSTLRGFST
eukprot:1955251-Pleurochrysis_carterae.AAC.2